jgi:type VI protein secretion system component Hcp
VAARALRQCGRTATDGPRRLGWREIMNKSTSRNVKTSVEVREPQDELSEAELRTVSGGQAMHDFHIGKYLDKASPKLF